MRLFLIYLGNFGSTEVLVLTLLFLLLVVAFLRRLFRASKPTVVVNQTAAPTSVADELVKLGSLRAQGLLNDAEFEAQKQRLLR